MVSEVELRNILETRFQNIFLLSRPVWLVNPATGRVMEIDCYNEQFRLAVDYDGPIFGHTRPSDLSLLKTRLCTENGILYLAVPYWYKSRTLSESYDANQVNKLLDVFYPI